MPKAVFKRLGIGIEKPTTVILQLADRSHVRPEGKFVFPVDFLILDCEVDDKAPIILGRPFLATGRILIDCEKGNFTMRVADQTMTINIKDFENLKKGDDEEPEATSCESHQVSSFTICPGHKISSKGIEVDKAKVEVIEKLPPPTNVKGIRSFLGHDGFYRRFIKYFSKISKPLCNLLQQNQPFVFDKECQNAFEELKMRLISAPVVMPPDWTSPLELMSYLIGTKVIVHTDHSAIKYLVTKKDPKPRLIRWILLLQEFDLEVKDRKGTENQVADHLSRLDNPHNQDRDVEISDSFPDEKILFATAISWYADIVNFLVSGIVPPDLSSQDRKKFRHDAKFFYWDEPYLFKQCADQVLRRCVPEEEQKDIMYHCHAASCGGHFGGNRTATKILQSERGTSQGEMKCHCRIF
ncbi:hypothetical protein GQ457_04G018050 [Hibiscus cannabinus]